MYKSIVSLALFAAQALAAIQFTAAPSAIEAGKSYEFSWSGGDSGAVTILLKNGPSTNLVTVGTIGSGSGPSGTVTWVAPSTYPPGTYSFEIDQGTAVNYWIPVPYTGGTGASAAPSGAPSVAPSVSAPPKSAASSAAPAASGSTHSTIATVIKNGTTTSTSSTTAKSTATSSSNSTSAKPTLVQSTNSAASLGSPVALVLGALAAMLYLQ